MDSTFIIALITALGLGSVIPALTNAVITQLSSRTAQEQARDAGALAMRDDAWQWAHRIQEEAEERIERSEAMTSRRCAERDAESQRALRLQEYAAWLRTLLIGAGMGLDELPPWPDAKVSMVASAK